MEVWVGKLDLNPKPSDNLKVVVPNRGATAHKGAVRVAAKYWIYYLLSFFYN